MKLASIGALAGGFAEGMERGQRLTLNDMNIKRQQRADAEADTTKADMDAANGAARAYMEGLKKEYQASLNPTDSVDPGGSALDRPVNVTPFRPTRAQLLNAAKLRTDKLFEMGRTELGIKTWMQDEQFRRQARQEAAERGMQVYQASGDPTELIKGVYENVDDGWDLKGVTGFGDNQFRIERVNARTGEKRESVIRGDQIEQMVAVALDPKASATFALRQKLEAFKGDQDRQTENVKHGNEMAEIGARGQAQKDVAAIRVNGTIKAAEIRKAMGAGGRSGSSGSNVQSKTVLSDGRIALTMRDGSTKIATHDDGTPMTAIDYEKLVGKEADSVGKTLEGGMKPRGAQRQEAASNLPKPPAGLPPGLPKGSKQIGTSKGKPVYETPDGKRFIAE